MEQLMGGVCGGRWPKRTLKRPWTSPLANVGTWSWHLTKRLIFSPPHTPVFSILECHAYSSGNRSFLHLFPTMKLQLTCQGQRSLSPMAVSIAARPGEGAASFRQLEQQLECISYSELVIWTFHFSWPRNRCTAAEEGTGKCQKMRKPVEQSVLCRRGSPQIKSYFRIDQIHMRPATVAIVTNKYAWLPEALPRKRTVTLVMKFVNFVSPLCSKVLIVTNYS